MVFALLAAAPLLLSAQSINIVAVANGADFQPGLPQKGSLASIFCTGLQGAAGIVSAPPQYPFPTELNGVTVWINFMPAPILAIAFHQGYQQINVQVPWEGLRDPLFVEVFQGSQGAHMIDPNAWVEFLHSDAMTFKWSVFFSDPKNYAVVQHALDYSRVTPQNPVHAGEFLVAYGINLGPVQNTPATGHPAPSDPLARSQPPALPCRMSDSLAIGAAIATPTYVGLAPGEVGVYQVDFQVPDTVTAGDQSLTFSRSFQINPFGPCLGSGMGSQYVEYTSRPVLLPVR